MNGVSPDAWFGALTAGMFAVAAGMVRLIALTTRTQTLLRAHLDDRNAHHP